MSDEMAGGFLVPPDIAAKLLAHDWERYPVIYGRVRLPVLDLGVIGPSDNEERDSPESLES